MNSAIPIRAVTDTPIKFVGLGEKMDAIEAFHPEQERKKNAFQNKEQLERLVKEYTHKHLLMQWAEIMHRKPLLKV